MLFEPASLLILLALSALSGLIGALVGIGGGVLLIPFLVLVQGVPIHHAVGASIVGVVASSSASASAYVQSRLSNIRLGLFLEAATSVGALAGALLSLAMPVALLELLFALTALYVGYTLLSARPGEAHASPRPDALATRLRLHSGYTLNGVHHEYTVSATPLGFLGSVGAGALSGLLGIGGGVIKVPLMSLGMGVPLRAAAATSNFMIGVTAATGAAVFVSQGYVVPELAAPVALGVTAGSLAGTSLSHRVHAGQLRLLLAAVLLITATQMLLRAAGVSYG